ncbi:cytochrome b [Vibrio fluminensis]|uniref:cytochrome b n=1 Tax=Vibrio fluminensis TaxID=2783614 RepID=UPI001887A7BF|nr:cytochrome b [Vibrio fluminensis]
MLNKHSLSIPTIALHWITGLAFIGVFALGLYMGELTPETGKFQIMGIHKSLGALILIVALIRIVWRLKEGSIPPASPVAVWQDKLAKAIHGILMLATIAMPISGLAMSVGGGRGADIFGWQFIAEGDKIVWLQELGGSIHGLSVNIIIAALVLHIAGAIKHQLVEKDGTISRMLGRAS